MVTELIVLKTLNDSFEDIIRAGELLRGGDIAAIPTETVYGLAASALSESAVKKIFEAKGRPQDNPLIVHISDFSELEKIVCEVPENAKKLAMKFWPGPLTMIFKKKDCIPDIVTAGLPSVAVRLPSNKFARAVIHAAGVPLAAPSANTSGKPSPTMASHVLDDLDGKIPMILDGGPCSVGLESTVIDLTSDTPVLLRPGGVTLAEIRETIGACELNPKILEPVEEDEKVASPGMKYKHYAPSAPVVILDGDIENAKKYIKSNINGKKVAILCFDEEIKFFDELNVTVISYGSAESPETLARGLFSALRKLDTLGVDIIYAREPRMSDGIELAVLNRLSRAAAFSRISI